MKIPINPDIIGEEFRTAGLILPSCEREWFGLF